MSSKFVLIAVACAFLISPIRNVLAYEIDTHAYLTDEIISFYNRNFSAKSVPEDLRAYALDGARREDDAPRWCNHFYDPVYDRGLDDPTVGKLLLLPLTYNQSCDIIGGLRIPSKQWAIDSYSQKLVKYTPGGTFASILSSIQQEKVRELFSSTDFTWQTAVGYWANDDKERAMFALGHILHLVEDASVPDHTRNDGHPADLGDPSPYEIFTSRYNLDSRDSGLQDRANSKSPMILDNLGDYLYQLASYSNKNFYSKDTLGIGVGTNKGYKLPYLDYDTRIGDLFYPTKEDSEFGPYFLFRKSKPDLVLLNKGSVTIDDARVLIDYWSRLSTKAVQYGAGVIDLFFKEAEAMKNDPNFKKQSEQKSLIASIADGAQNILTTVGGAIQKAVNVLEGILKRDNAQIEESQKNLPLENSANNEASDIPDQTAISENANAEQIDSELTAGEEVKADVGEFQDNPGVTLTESEKAAIAQMLARLDDLMRQAAELKSKIEAKENSSINGTVENKIASPSNSGGTTSYASGGGGQVSQNASSNSTANNSALATSTTTSSSSNNNAASSTPAVSTSTETVATSTLGHVVISEILFDAVGSDEGKEFVEIYNPTSQSLDLGGWSLKYSRSDSTSSISLASFKPAARPEDQVIIPAKGFLLVGLNGYDPVNYGKSADIVRTAALPNGASAGDEGAIFTVRILNDGNGEIDSMTYASSSIGAAGESLERKAKSSDGECISAAAVGEFLGHDCDSGSNSDFDARPSPNPQNSSSLPEPRQAPGLSGAAVSYSSSSVSLNFSWNESIDSSGATSSISYEIRDASSSDIFATTTGALGLNRGIREIGKDYGFIFKAVDRDGLSSATTSLVVSAPSFFDKFYFYADPRSPGQNVTDAYYSKYPFIPGSANTWKLLLLYLNADAQRDEHLIEENGFRPADASHFLSVARFADSAGPEDLHLISPVTLPEGTSKSTSTYITAAFYDWEMRYGAYVGFQMVAVDRQKYYFRESAPSSSPPLSPADLTLQFDELHSNLNLSWPRAADPDSPDSSVTYRLNYSTSTEFSTSSEWSVGVNLTSGMPVAFGNNYKVIVKAVDDFGNVSNPTEKNWSFPEGFIQMPFQRESGGDPIGDSGGAGQKILISNNANVNKVAMVMAMDGGAYSVTDTFIEIRSDNGGGMGDLVASSSDISRSWPMSDRPIRDEFIFSFPQPVNLSAGTYYWLKPVNGPGISNKNFIYGTTTDIYPDGHWSGNPGADAYFYIR